MTFDAECEFPALMKDHDPGVLRLLRTAQALTERVGSVFDPEKCGMCEHEAQAPTRVRFQERILTVCCKHAKIIVSLSPDDNSSRWVVEGERASLEEWDIEATTKRMVRAALDTVDNSPEFRRVVEAHALKQRQLGMTRNSEISGGVSLLSPQAPSPRVLLLSPQALSPQASLQSPQARYSRVAPLSSQSLSARVFPLSPEAPSRTLSPQASLLSPQALSPRVLLLSPQVLSPPASIQSPQAPKDIPPVNPAPSFSFGGQTKPDPRFPFGEQTKDIPAVKPAPSFSFGGQTKPDPDPIRDPWDLAEAAHAQLAEYEQACALSNLQLSASFCWTYRELAPQVKSSQSRSTRVSPLSPEALSPRDTPTGLKGSDLFNDPLLNLPEQERIQHPSEDRHMRRSAAQVPGRPTLLSTWTGACAETNNTPGTRIGGQDKDRIYWSQVPDEVRRAEQAVLDDIANSSQYDKLAEEEAQIQQAQIHKGICENFNFGNFENHSQPSQKPVNSSTEITETKISSFGNLTNFTNFIILKNTVDTKNTMQTLPVLCGRKNSLSWRSPLSGGLSDASMVLNRPSDDVSAIRPMLSL